MTISGTRRLGRATVLTFLACLLAQGAVVSNAFGIDFDPRGVATLDSAFTQSFEEPLDGDAFLAEEGAELEYDSEVALEGDRSLVIGDGLGRVLLMVPRSEFSGRRVNLKFWYRADGTDVSARLVWANRSIQSFGDDVLSLGSVTLSPTGRATSDGWVELETAPVDWEFAEAGGPVGLVISDTQYTRRNRRPDNTLSARIDALEIENLSAAAVPKQDCSLPDENSQCGPQGVCWLGKCVDAAAALGSVPSEDYRDDYLQRRKFLVKNTLAIRRTRSNLDQFSQTLDGLAEAAPKGYWTRMVSAWEKLRDGHASPPSGQTVQATSPQGICLGPGKADLLPDSDEAPVPMVFQPGESNLRRGDVVTAIDGLSVDDWAHAARRYLYYNADPRGREALRVNDVLRAAVQTGATVEFTRCEASGTENLDACEPSETTTVEIDFSQTVGEAVWQGESVSALDDESGRFCDYRFDKLRPDGEGIQSGAAYFSESETGLLRAEFFDMPQPRRRGEPLDSWKEAWNENLSDRPDRVMVDQRLGFGGGFRAVHFLGDLFMKGATAVREAGFPWYGSDLDIGTLRALQDCLEEQRDGSSCGGLFVSGISANEPTTELGDDAKLAMVTANAVSGNDFFAKYLTFRDAETRIFGYSPTAGAFGAVRRLHSLPGESQAPSYQFHDTRFLSADQTLPQSSFSSGRGVQPDEIVYQKQSDALRGVDSIVQAAREWLENSEN